MRNELDNLAKAKIRETLNFIAEQNLTLKVAGEFEWMLFDDADQGREVLSDDQLVALKSALEHHFGENIIGRVYEECAIGATASTAQADFDVFSFHLPGVRHYEITTLPLLDPIRAVELCYEIKSFMQEYVGKELPGVRLEFGGNKPLRDDAIAAHFRKIPLAQLKDQMAAQTRSEQREDGLSREQAAEYLEAIDTNYEGFIQKYLAHQGIDPNIEFNFSVWSGDMNLFFTPGTDKNISDTLQQVAHRLCEALATSTLPLGGGTVAYADFFNPENIDREAASFIGLSPEGKSLKTVARVAPYCADEDSSEDDATINHDFVHDEDGRRNANTRLEVRNIVDSGSVYVAMLVLVIAIYKGMVNPDPSYATVMMRESYSRIEVSFEEAINKFRASTLWPELLGTQIYNLVLQEAEQRLRHEQTIAAASAAATGDVRLQAPPATTAGSAAAAGADPDPAAGASGAPTHGKH